MLGGHLLRYMYIPKGVIYYYSISVECVTFPQISMVKFATPHIMNGPQRSACLTKGHITTSPDKRRWPELDGAYRSVVVK